MQTQVHLAPVSRWDEGAPAIHGPDVYGASPLKPFLYAIPSTGERPLLYAAEGLPQGLVLDPRTGHITGVAAREGDFRVLLRAENRHGRAEKEFAIAIGRGLALTPPMGWNSWNAWRRWIDDARTRAAADALVATGLAARGYCHVNIDSCWQGERGGPFNAIQPNRKFPDMKALGRYLHARGLKFGIYSTPWVEPWGCSAKEAAEDWGGSALIGCSSGEPDPEAPKGPYFTWSGKFVGKVKHEPDDVAQWVDWEVDYLKYDWNPTDPASLERMGRPLKAAARDIILSLCTDARLAHVAAFKQWAHLWRGIPDTYDHWSSLLKNAFMSEDYLQEDWRPHIGPGAWNDLDMFALGPQFSSPTASCPNRLTPDEQITHMTAWAIYPSPLILSCDLAALGDFELRLFGNEEVIAVNQDHLGKPAVRVAEHRAQCLGATTPRSETRIWARPLSGGAVAVACFNLGDQPAEVGCPLQDLGLSGPATVRNLWERRDLTPAEGRVSITVPAHGAQLLQLRSR